MALGKVSPLEMIGAAGAIYTPRYSYNNNNNNVCKFIIVSCQNRNERMTGSGGRAQVRYGVVFTLVWQRGLRVRNGRTKARVTAGRVCFFVNKKLSFFFFYFFTRQNRA